MEEEKVKQLQEDYKKSQEARWKLAKEVEELQKENEKLSKKAEAYDQVQGELKSLRSTAKQFEKLKKEKEALQQSVSEYEEYVNFIRKNLTSYIGAFENTLKNFQGGLDNAIELEALLRDNFKK